MAPGDPNDEYVDVSTNVRHWNTLRFAELTVYIAFMGAMLNVVFGKATPLSPSASVLIKIVGALVSLLFLILHERTMAWWYNFVRRAVELEKVLEFEQYSTRPAPRPMSGRSAVRLFFLVITLFWLLSIFLSPV